MALERLAPMVMSWNKKGKERRLREGELAVSDNSRTPSTIIT